MQNAKGFGFLATLATVARMLGYRNDKPKAQIKPDRAAPPSLRNTKRSKYARHQGARECARRMRQPGLSHVPNLAALREQRREAA